MAIDYVTEIADENNQAGWPAVTNCPLPAPSPRTLLAVQALEAQGAVTLVALLPGPAAAPVGTGARHAWVGCVVHVHAAGEVVPHVDGAVVQGDLGEEAKTVRGPGNTRRCVKGPLATDPDHAQRELREEDKGR